MGTRFAVATLCLAAIGASAGCGAPEEPPGTPLAVSVEQLETLFDEIVEKTARREAFSEVKEDAGSFS
ncbi:MAG: hypothetical protein OXI45_09080, partial [Acidobacteriota bacterium]|nr:hypothetical protein [Acidobacteriota bacterium]